MNVRPAVPDDAPAIAALHVRAWQVAYAGTFPGGYLMNLDVDEWAARRRRRIEEIAPPSAFYVADDAEGVCGFTHVGPYRADGDDAPGPQVGEVYGIYVHPARWSTGAGLALMRAAVAELTDAAFTEIKIWVLDANPRARRFYERFGFTADGAAKDYTLDRGGRHETRVPEVRYTLHVR
jgi:RimJ/RimL family protein N-acetyltransferase